MTQRLTQYDGTRLAEYSLRVQVGDLYAPDGLTELILTGEGALSARLVREELDVEQVGESERGKKPPEGATAEGELSPEETEDVIRRAFFFPWSRTFPSRPGIPDEAIVEWRLSGTDGAGQTVKVWLREAESDPDFKPVLEALRRGLARISDSQLYL